MRPNKSTEAFKTREAVNSATGSLAFVRYIKIEICFSNLTL